MAFATSPNSHNTTEGVAGIQIVRSQHGVSHETFLPAGFFATADYRVLGELATHLDGLIGEDARVLRGEKSAPITHFEQAIDWLMQEGRRGLGFSATKVWVR